MNAQDTSPLLQTTVSSPTLNTNVFINPYYLLIFTPVKALCVAISRGPHPWLSSPPHLIPPTTQNASPLSLLSLWLWLWPSLLLVSPSPIFVIPPPSSTPKLFGLETSRSYHRFLTSPSFGVFFSSTIFSSILRRFPHQDPLQSDLISLRD